MLFPINNHYLLRTSVILPHYGFVFFCFPLQVKVSFDLDNVQIKYIDEDNDEVKYLLPHPTSNSTEKCLVAEMTPLPRDDLSFRRVCYTEQGGGMFPHLIRKQLIVLWFHS